MLLNIPPSGIPSPLRLEKLEQLTVAPPEDWVAVGAEVEVGWFAGVGVGVSVGIAVGDGDVPDAVGAVPPPPPHATATVKPTAANVSAPKRRYLSVDIWGPLELCAELATGTNSCV